METFSTGNGRRTAMLGRRTMERRHEKRTVRNYSIQAQWLWSSRSRRQWKPTTSDLDKGIKTIHSSRVPLGTLFPRSAPGPPSDGCPTAQIGSWEAPPAASHLLATLVIINKSPHTNGAHPKPSLHTNSRLTTGSRHYTSWNLHIT